MTTTLHKRRLLQAAALAALTTTLTACGQKEEPIHITITPAASAEAAPADKLKVGFMYVGPIGDGGWTQQHNLGRLALEEKFGDKIETTFIESVAESADAERVLRDLASQGNTLIFAASFGFQEYVQKAAADLPNVHFEHATGYKRGPNVATYDIKTFEGAYLAGIVAGGMSQTKTIGVVGSVPIPEVVRNINSFVLGAQSVDPDIKAKVVWVNDWFSPPKESEAAASLINGGVDVLYQNTNSPAVLKMAEERGVRALGKDGDLSSFAPKAHLGSAVLDWSPYYIQRVEAALAGQWQGDTTYWGGVKEGAIDLVKIADDVPDDIKARVEKARAGLKDESFAVWTGPIVDNTGKEVLAAGQVADTEFLMGINFYVNGIEGKVPGSE